jgi:hypothetical protein
MASNIDPTKPITGAATTASVRANFAAAKAEIEALGVVGVWSPTLTFGTPGDLAVTYQRALGSVRKAGDLIILTWIIVTATFTHTTAAGALEISGKPYPLESTPDMTAFGTCGFSGLNKPGAQQVTPIIVNTDNQIRFWGMSQGATLDNVNAADVPSGGTIILGGTLTYLTNA